ncbi:hypothetical protein [Qingshengfaniella alkalisoli]|uniref:Uncharacterized protein n=1 Tax=Qingshengfaniella alkalisoli TaxID=2599296 RepID=A0A5B8I5X5_9RHOB|nr:hypothetical protein [Qingshengfaniella alkalisoli]QDY68805.1 hypothetical protein FPZ52_03615 [Qingshengfaniella alkalisoli]
MIGHNGGPTLEKGTSWRKHCWGKARRDLLPVLPLQIIRQRVRRAEELGLDYKTYATVRATSGCDIVGFLFSSNALHLVKVSQKVPRERAEKLAAIRNGDILVAAHQPHDPLHIARRLEEDHAISLCDIREAPPFTDSWSAVRDRMRRTLSDTRLRGASVVLVGETAFEREWTAAGNFAAYLPSDRYFAKT